MRRIAITLVLIILAGCGRAAVSDKPAPQGEPPAPAEAPSDPRPDLTVIVSDSLGRAELREGLERLMNTGGGEPKDKLRQLRTTPPSADSPSVWAEADLDGDGHQEYVVVLRMTDPDTPTYLRGQGAALAVIYQRDGRYVADVSQPMSDRVEHQLMAPSLDGVADLIGAGQPQIVWSRPVSIVTGPRPLYVFVTAWTPGSFSTIPGDMVISSTPKNGPLVSIQGNDVVLTGGSRLSMFLSGRVDRYRFSDGSFKLVDRRFVDSGEDAYSRFWDGLVAEDVRRLADAEQAYAAVLDPALKAHSGEVPRYHALPVQLTESEVAAFGEALRAFARFRLGALLLSEGRPKEALDLLNQASGPYTGLTKALSGAGNREAGCKAAAAWAAATPEFLYALNRGVADAPWTPELLCAHETIDDRLP